MDTRSLDGNGISQMAEPTDMLGEHLNSSSRPLMSNTFSPRVSSEEPSVVLRVATDDVAARAVMAELDLSGADGELWAIFKLQDYTFTKTFFNIKENGGLRDAVIHFMVLFRSLWIYPVLP